MGVVLDTAGVSQAIAWHLIPRSSFFTCRSALGWFKGMLLFQCSRCFALLPGCCKFLP